MKKNLFINQNKNTIILMILIIAIVSIISPNYTYCSFGNEAKIEKELNSTIIEELNTIDFSGFNEILIEFENNNTNISALSNIKEKVYSIISGKNAVDYNNVFASIFSGIVDIVVRYLPILSLVIAIGIISNLLSGIKSKFNEKSTGELVHLVCFLSAALLVIGIISNLTKNAGRSIDNIVNQMNILFPILLTLMTGLGAHASVGVFQPVVAIMSTYIADFFNYFIVPLFIISFVFGLISNLSSNVKLDKLESFIHSLFKWSVGLIFTIFFAIFTIQGISAGSFDSLSIRTTKYAIKSYVPIMGGYLSDGMDIILSSTLLIKNSLGLVGVLLILTSILSPLLDIVIFSLLLKLVSAVLQPMGNSKTSNFLTSTSKSLTMLTTSIIAIGFMYLINIGLVMTTANVVL